jgi:hypothetical protein
MSSHVRTLLGILFAAGLLLAQDRGTIRGTVSDPSGAAVPDASVTAKNAATGLTQASKTGADGIFNILYLPAGIYSVTTEAAGFRKAETTDVKVEVATVVAVEVRLSVGGLEQAVEVTASTPLLDMQGTNLGKVIPASAIRDLPLFLSGGIRSNLAFVILTPGVIGSASNPRIGGGLLDGQSEQLDGAESQSERRNDPAMNGVSVEGMQEFKVQSSSYSAEYGRTSNGVINWVTKSGANRVHGSGFVFNRNEFFNARGFTFTASKRSIIRTWNPGGSFGGPVYIPKLFDGRNKAFFFFAYEKAMNRNGQSTSLTTLVVDEYRIGDMRRNVDSSGRTIPLYDPLDAAGNIIADATRRPRMQCNGVLDVICPDRIDPMARTAVAMLPHPDDPSRITQNYRSRSYSQSRTALPSIKLDYVFNDRHRASFLYSHYFSPAQRSINAIEGLPGTGFPTDVLIEYYRYNDDYVLQPNLLNHLTIGFNKRRLVEAPSSVWNAPKDWATLFALKGVPTPIPPGVNTVFGAGGITWGNSVFTDSRQRTFDLKEQLAWIAGKHTFKFGMQYLKGQYRRLDYNNAFGSMSFSSAGTGNPTVANSGSDWASFLLGMASGGSFRYPSDTTFFWPYFAWYAQDDFKVSRKLTLNIGLRYEIPVPKQERRLHNSNFCPTCPNAAAGGRPGAMIFAGVDGAPKRFGETRMNAWGPRLGLAYELNPRTVIRTGSAIYYQPLREDGNADNGIQGFGGSFSATANSLSSGIAYLRKDGLTAFAPQIKENTPPLVDPTIQLYGTPFYYNPKAGRAPYFADWQFTIERTVTANSVVRASYHGVAGVKMLSRQQSQNQLDPKYWPAYGSLLSTPISSALTNPAVVAAGFKLPFESYRTNLQLQQALRPYPQYSGIDSNAGGQNDGHSTFHALETSFEHHFTGGLYALVSYTFCKLISTTNGEDANRSSDGAVQNQYNRRADKAVASEDTPHNLRISYVYELPVGKGKKWLNAMHPILNGVVGNWKISGIQSYVSGTPLVFNCGQNLYGAGSNARCSFAPGVAQGTVPLLNPAWSSDYGTAFSVPALNKSAIVLPANMTYGDTPRRMSYFRTPWSQSEQVALMKNFAVGEKVNLEMRASASNPLNRVTLAGFNTSQNSVNFGMITSPQGNSPRVIQLGARISF